MFGVSKKVTKVQTLDATFKNCGMKPRMAPHEKRAVHDNTVT